MASKVKWVKLGDYIEPLERRNTDGAFGLDYVRGISNSKEIMPTKATVDPSVIRKFYVIYPTEFVYNPRTTRMGDKVGLAYNYTNTPLLFSFNNLAFRIKDDKKDSLLSEFLYLFFSRSEFDRYARVNSWGSATELFTYKELSLINFPLPSPKEQEKVVNAWKALREIKEQNEAKAAPLMQLCQSYIQELKHKYPAQEIGPYIEEITRTNAEGLYGESDVRGVSNDKTMREYKGSLAGRDFKKFLLIKENEFVFNKRTNAGMGLCLVKDRPYIFTEDYEAFRIIDKNKLLPEFLYLFIVREEFDRYVLFNSWGSSVVFFHIADMKHVSIPLPPLDVQRAIVNIYKCANEAKQIAAEADRLSREVSPALIQHVIHS